MKQLYALHIPWVRLLSKFQLDVHNTDVQYQKSMKTKT